jgi:hypothetical protein
MKAKSPVRCGAVQPAPVAIDYLMKIGVTPNSLGNAASATVGSLEPERPVIRATEKQ